MLLPGPEAQQLAIYIGWLLNGVTRRPRRRHPVRAARRRSRCWRCRPSTSPSATPTLVDRALPRARPGGDRHRRPGRRPGRPPRARPPRPGRRWRSPRSSPSTFFARPVPGRRARRRARSAGCWAGPSPALTGTAERPPPTTGRPPLISDDAPAHRTPVRPPVRASSCRSAWSLWFAPVALAGLAVRPVQHLRRPGPVLLRRRGGHLRRRLRRAGLRRPAGRQRLRLAAPGRDGPRPRPGRDHPRPADHGGAVRRVRRRLPRPRRPQPVGRRRHRRRCSSPG